MFENHGRKPSAPGRAARGNALRITLVVTALVALAGVASCENKGLGRSCNLGQTIPPEQGAYSVNASDCQTRICVKPAVQPGVSQDPKVFDTTAYCSDMCTTDSDCQGEIRDRSNPNDHRCKSGYTCAIPFGAADSVPGGGQLCCQKICLCRDFFLASVGPTTPASCQDGSTTSCSNPGPRD